MRIKWILISFLLFLFACKSKDIFDPINYQSQKLHFGSGGGFAGIEKEYVLLDNGQLYFKISRDTIYHTVTTLDKNLTQQFFNTYQNLGSDTLDINSPGNQYYFLENTKEEKSNRMVWGNSDGTPPENVKALYENLISIAKKHNIQK